MTRMTPKLTYIYTQRSVEAVCGSGVASGGQLECLYGTSNKVSPPVCGVSVNISLAQQQTILFQYTDLGIFCSQRILSYRKNGHLLYDQLRLVG